MTNIGIYGAGSYGKTLLHVMQQQGKDADFFIDEFSNNEYVDGKPVYRIDQAPNKKASIYVSVALVPNDADATSDIAARLDEAGFKHVYDFQQAIRAFPPVLEAIASHNKLWMRANSEEMLDRAQLAQVKALLCDDKSIDLLENIIAFREHMNADTYVAPDGHLEYFPADIDLLSHLDTLRFIDCGAFTGDTLKAISDLKRTMSPCLPPSIEYLVSFEPDRQNFKQLTHEIELLKPLHPKTLFMSYPLAIWNEAAILHFDANQSSSSNIIDANTDDAVTIASVSLDDTLYAASPNYIKMDIEGAEREAILGAKKIIARQSPVLAICVYHKPADLWELPLLIQQINPNYRMYLRSHSHMGLSTVLYCVPR